MTPAVTTPHTAARLNHSLTAGAERRLLLWLAARLPASVTPDGLTLLGLLAQCGAGLSLALVRVSRDGLLLAALCLVLNWLGDSLDGTVARLRRQERPRYGFYVDHAVDLLGAAALFAGLAFSGLMHPAMALAALCGFLLLAAESYLATHTLSRFEMSQGPFGPTELRLLLLAGFAAAWHSPWCHLLGHRVLLWDVGGMIAVAAMGATLLCTTARHTAELYRLETTPAIHRARHLVRTTLMLVFLILVPYGVLHAQSASPAGLPQAPAPAGTAYQVPPSGSYLYHVGIMCALGASTSPVSTHPTAGCGAGFTFVPLPVFVEVGVMGPQANRSYVSGYVSADLILPLRPTKAMYRPMLLAGYSRLFETGHALDYGIALALPQPHHPDDGSSLRLEVRDYWTFADPTQHNVFLRLGIMTPVSV